LAPSRARPFAWREAAGGSLPQLREKLGRTIVDKDGTLQLIDALSDPEKAAVKDDDTLKKQMISVFDAKQMLRAAVSLKFPLMLKLYMINEAGGIRGIGGLSAADWTTALEDASNDDIEQVGGWEKNGFIAETPALLQAFAGKRPTALLVFAR